MPHTCDSNVPKSILIGVEYSKVVIDFVNAIIFHPMTPLLV